LHHCLLRLGYSHRQTVLIIYGMSAIFGLAAVIFSKVQTMWGSFLVLAILLVAIEIIVEKIGLVDKTYRPILNMVRGLRLKN